jgi:DNA-binding XRE family transcriptional regulator
VPIKERLRPCQHPPGSDRAWPAFAENLISQARAAAILEIAERSYKNYESEIRELPLSVARRFCERFEQDLLWLIEGQRKTAAERDIDLVGDTIEAVVADQRCEELG